MFYISFFSVMERIAPRKFLVLKVNNLTVNDYLQILNQKFRIFKMDAAVCH